MIKDVNRTTKTEENAVTIDNIEALLNSVDGCGQNFSDPLIHKCQLRHIAECVIVPPHTITNSTSPSLLANIMEITREVKSQFQADDDMSTDDNENGQDVEYFRKPTK